MAHIKNRLRGLLVAFVALVAALAIVPGVANALSNDSTGTVTISGLNPGDKVTLYKVVDTTYSDPVENGNNTIDHEWNSSIKNYMETTGQLNITQYEVLQNDPDGDEGSTAATIWNAVSSAKGNGSAVSFPENAPVTVGEDGTFTASNLPMGQYYVEITPAEGTLRTYQHMIVSVQPTDETDGTWGDPVMGTEVKQPKYTEETDIGKEITGTADKQGYLPGSDVDFTITTSIPSYAQNTDFNETTLTVTDVRTNLETPESYTVTVGGLAVEPSADTFTIDDTTTPGTTVFTFVGSFLEANQNKEIVITYTATVSGETDWDEAIENQATVDPGNGAKTDDDTVTIELYKVIGKKVNDEGIGLEGAHFAIYRESNGTPDLQMTGDSADVCVAEDIVSKAQGAFEFAPLAQDGTYYLVETQAPAGYTAFEGVIATFDTNDTDENPIADNTIVLADIVNSKDEGIHLPQTGGAGTVALTAGGVVLVAGAAAFIVRARKEN